MSPADAVEDALRFLFSKDGKIVRDNVVEDALDAHGLFRRQADGTLEFDEFLTLKEIILRQSLRLFAPKKAVLTEQKIKALKEKNTKEYMKLAHFLRLEYHKCLLTITKKACEEISLRPAMFQ